ncbi:hypothetical protein D3C80_1541820 [compost metagenome]
MRGRADNHQGFGTQPRFHRIDRRQAAEGVGHDRVKPALLPFQLLNDFNEFDDAALVTFRIPVCRRVKTDNLETAFHQHLDQTREMRCPRLPTVRQQYLWPLLPPVIDHRLLIVAQGDVSNAARHPHRLFIAFTRWDATWGEKTFAKVGRRGARHHKIHQPNTHFNAGYGR